MRIRQRSAAAVGFIVLSVVLALAGCSQGSSTSADANGTVNLKVALSPSAGTAAPIYYGAKNGIYAKHGLNVELNQTTDGSVVVPQIMSGQLQFAMTSFESYLNALTQGLPVQMTGAANLLRSGEYSGVIVPAKNPPADMSAVKVFAVQDSARNPQMQLVAEGLKGNYANMEMLQVPFGSIADTVASGAAGAGFLIQPFLGQALARGDVKLLSYVDDSLTVPGAPGAIFIANTQYLGQNSDIAKRFIAATQEALSYSAAHKDEISAFTKSAGLTDNAIAPANLPAYPEKPVALTAVQKLAKLYSDGKYINAEPAVEKLAWRDGGGFS